MTQIDVGKALAREFAKLEIKIEVFGEKREDGLKAADIYAEQEEARRQEEGENA